MRSWFGLPVAFAAQNGLEDMDVPWCSFDVLFLGGDDAWKLGPAARELVAEAKQRHKKVHMGRVNSLKRLWYAEKIGPCCQRAEAVGRQRPGRAVAVRCPLAAGDPPGSAPPQHGNR